MISACCHVRSEVLVVRDELEIRGSFFRSGAVPFRSFEAKNGIQRPSARKVTTLLKDCPLVWRISEVGQSSVFDVNEVSVEELVDEDNVVCLLIQANGCLLFPFSCCWGEE